ncbi:hypothetical protein ACIBO9_49070 [Streptomyces prunicolor]|uniref:hypothetical protein n=1 Tax=Streptomyces prunicolor TaxID=67348 RepID=UPI0037D2C1FC
MTSPALDRRALLIAVSGFEDGDNAPEADLDFAPGAIRDLATVLEEGFGFAVTTVTEPGITSETLGQRVRETLESAGPDSVLLVHLLTHGESRDGFLYALGADAVPHENTEVGAWLASLQHRDGRPVALFTLDLCNSGTVTRIPWQSRYDRTGRRGWVIAACEPDSDAFNGHFTMALTEVLGDLAAQRLDVASQAAYIPLGTLVDSVRRAVLRLNDTHRTYRQYVTASRVEVSDKPVVLPFFPNPAHVRTADPPSGTAPRNFPAPASARSLGTLLELTGPDPDVRHFVQSAVGLTGVLDQHGGGFSGRAHELHRLSRWMGGAGTAGPAVVTGSPGAGKSALLGLLVCAAHPRLREHTREVWGQVTAAPEPVEGLAVVHARDRRLDAIAGSLGRQLGLGDLDSEQFLTAIHTRPPDRPPTLVLDALDEADDTAAICAWLARLCAPSDDGNRSAPRVLIATRRYEESAELRGLAASNGHSFDLDKVGDAQLLEDLYVYVSGLLRRRPVYRSHHKTTGAFAGALSETLVSRRGGDWGEFLVAGLYTLHFLATFDPAAGSEAAERFAAAAPRTLAEVFDLELSHAGAGPWLRSVLTALAHSRGEGMPASVILRVIAAMSPGARPSLPDIRTALARGHTYVRRSVGEDSVPVWRLFHDGLARHLRREQDAAPVLQGLLDGLGPATARQWSAAEPYLLRHVLEHAEPDPTTAGEIRTDPGYLVHADALACLPSLTGQVQDVVRRWRSVHRGTDRRTAFALAAVEEGHPALARRVAELPGESPLPWTPLWAAVGETDDAALSEPTVAVITNRGELHSWNRHWTDASVQPAPRAVALCHRDGRRVLVLGTSQGRIEVAELSGRTTTLARRGAAVTALTATAGAEGAFVVSGSSAGDVAAHHVESGEPLGPTVLVGGAPPTAVTAIAHAGSLAVGCVSGQGQLWSWYAGGITGSAPHAWPTSSPVLSAALGPCGKRLVLVAGCADGTTVVWDMRTHTRQRLLDGTFGAANAVAVGRLRDRHVTVVGSQEGYVEVWDLSAFTRVGEPIPVGGEPVRALALHRTEDGDLHCLVGGDGPTRLWSLGRQSRLRDFGGPGAVQVALAGPAPTASSGSGSAALRATAVGAVVPGGGTGGPLAVYGRADGSCHAVDLATGRRVWEPLPGNGEPIIAVEQMMLGGAPVALLRWAGRRNVWDVAASGAHARLADPEPVGQTEAAGSLHDAALVAGALVNVRADALGRVMIDERLVGRHHGVVNVLSTARLAGRPVAFSGGVDGTVRVWDLADRCEVAALEFDSPVFAVGAVGDGRLLVGAGGSVYAWEHVSRRS